jgi:glutathione S-transferase
VARLAEQHRAGEPDPLLLPERWGDEAAAAQVKAHAETKIGTLLDQLDAEFARHGGPWLLGESFSICDPYAFVLCRWTRGFGRPARDLPH